MLYSDSSANIDEFTCLQLSEVQKNDNFKLDNNLYNWHISNNLPNI